MTPSETAAILALLYSQWPEAKATDDDAARELALWQFAFAHDPYPTVELGVHLWFKGGKPFMPKPAEIRQMLADRAYALDVDQLWGEVRRAMRTYGRDAVAFLPTPAGWREVPRPPLHPLVESVITAFGWKEMVLDDRPDILRVTFTKALERRIALAKEDVVFGTKALPIPESTPAPSALPAADDDEDPDAVWSRGDQRLA
jgi:hypothetical protein